MLAFWLPSKIIPYSCVIVVNKKTWLLALLAAQALQHEAIIIVQALVDAFPNVHMPLMDQVCWIMWAVWLRCTHSTQLTHLAP